MKERIRNLTELTVSGQLYHLPDETKFDREDIFLPPLAMEAKRTKEYILNQTPHITEFNAFTGHMRFGHGISGDIFNRSGHNNHWQAQALFYNQPINGLCTYEWQHFVGDFEKILKIGMQGYKTEIENSRKNHTEKEDLEFLDALSVIADAIIGWAEKCSDAAAKKAAEVSNEEHKSNLIRLSKALKKVPENPPESFYEAVLTVYFMFAFIPDSVGTLDRYLYPYYKKDIESESLNKEDAAAYLQELFLMLQANKDPESDRFYRGGESHFCIGGYLPNGEDGFTELSELIVDSLLELPTWIPEISFRWTKKTPRDVLKFIMESERSDPNKRIAIVNDEPRIKAMMEISGMPFENACKYTMCGCNEPQLPGGMFMGGCTCNVVKSIERTFFNSDAPIASQSFDEFYNEYEKNLYEILDEIISYYDKFQEVRARDTNIVSTMFFEGSIKRAKSITQGGAERAFADLSLIGITTVVDSLAIVKQFVFDEQITTLKELYDAVRANWKGYEELRRRILKSGKYFGNDDDTSNECAGRFATSLGNYFDGKVSCQGYHYIMGNLIGYNQHNKWFGELTKATPDGRSEGDIISFGIGQSEGRDREGLTALLSSVAKLNGHSILCGDTVTNVLIEKQLVDNDESFEKLIAFFEAYLKMGGMHFQLTYVSKEDLKNAQISPDKYKSLRVRVSGFSDYFVLLNEDLQDEIITRTEKR